MDDATRLSALDEAIELMLFGHRRLVEEPDRLLARQGLGRVHHRVLYWVRRIPGIRVGDLLRILEVSKQALHRPLGELIERGLVAAVPDEHDTRVKRLRLSARGIVLERRLSDGHRRRFAAVFDALGPAAEAAWRRVMAEIGGRGRALALIARVEADASGTTGRTGAAAGRRARTRDRRPMRAPLS